MLAGPCRSQPLYQREGCATLMLQAMDPPVLGLYRDVLALVFLSAGICRRPPWDSSPLPFSGLSGRGQMLSRVEETNEPTLRSQLGPPGAGIRPTPSTPPPPAHGGFLGRWGPCSRGSAQSHPGGTRPAARCRHLLARPAAAWLNVNPAALRTFGQLELQQGPEARQ